MIHFNLFLIIVILVGAVGYHYTERQGEIIKLNFSSQLISVTELIWFFCNIYILFSTNDKLIMLYCVAYICFYCLFNFFYIIEVGFINMMDTIKAKNEIYMPEIIKLYAMSFYSMYSIPAIVIFFLLPIK